jgi:hypothetical protein
MEEPMFKRALTAVALGFLVSACAGGPAPEPTAPAPLDPTGTYDIVVAAQGYELFGTMTIRGSADEGYTGYVDTDMGGADVTNIQVDGQTLTFYISDADITGEVVFEGNDFRGQMDGGMGGASITGKKRVGN